MREMLKEKSGITLIALVVTIVILIILATISVNLVINGGLINKTQNAANLDDLAREKERLELVKGQVAADIENLGKVTVDNYVAELIKEGITVEAEVTDNGDGSKTVITDTGYSVTIVPKGDRDVEIIIDGKAGTLPPRIAKLETTTTTSSFTAKAQVLRVNGGTVKYYYKLATESDDKYQEITNITAEKGAEVTGLVAGTIYDVKVVAENSNGTVEQKTQITVTKIMVESISLKAGEIVKLGKTITVTATINPGDATNKNVTWTSSDPEIATINNAGVVTGIKEGETTITVTATDGSNKTATCKVTVTPPTVADYKENDVFSNTTAIKDELGNQVVIPGGFKVAEDSGSTVKEGVVVEDSIGNQFVWIPVSNINGDGTGKIKINSRNEEGTEIILGRYDFNTSNGNTTIQQKGSDWSQTVTILDCFQELYISRESDVNSTYNTTAKNLSAFIGSVQKNRGYYIGRYEASYKEYRKACIGEN